MIGETDYLLQAASTAVRISVVADGQEKIVKLPNTVYDGTLQKSLISKARADATHGLIQPKAPITAVDNRGTRHTSSSTITLRWYYDSGLQSFKETFYVVDRLPLPEGGGGGDGGGGGEWDAMLRKGVERSPEHSPPQAYPYVKTPPQTNKDPQPGTLSAKEKQLRYLKEKAAEAERIRKALETKK